MAKGIVFPDVGRRKRELCVKDVKELDCCSLLCFDLRDTSAVPVRKGIGWLQGIFSMKKNNNSG